MFNGKTRHFNGHSQVRKVLVITTRGYKYPSKILGEITAGKCLSLIRSPVATDWAPCLSWTCLEVAEKNPGYAADDMFVEETEEAYLGGLPWTRKSLGKGFGYTKRVRMGFLLDLELFFVELWVKCF